MAVLGVLVFVPTLYISLDTALHWTQAFHLSDKDLPDLRASALFVLTLLIPALSALLRVSLRSILTVCRRSAALLYLVMMLYVVIGILKETKPARAPYANSLSIS